MESAAFPCYGTLEQYKTMNHQDFVQEVERRLIPLRARHAESLRCRRGCSSCCTDVTLLPVEWHAIEVASGPDAHRASNDEPDRCPYLTGNGMCNGVCGIYAARPLICRVHGLPLSYPLEEYDFTGRRILHNPPDRHVLWCDLNFPGVDKFEPVFSEEEVFDMVWLHRELDELNGRFLRTEAGAAYKDGTLLSLRDQVKKGGPL